MSEDPNETTKKYKPQICYNLSALPPINKEFYLKVGQSVKEGRAQLVENFQIPARDGRAFRVKKGQIFRTICNEGPQVADTNLWNADNPEEMFYSTKTRQLQRNHLTTLDRLWSNMPYLRPMATITGDSIQYPFDQDGAGVHDITGSRCDPYTNAMLAGTDDDHHCHSNLIRAVVPFGLTERHVHDVFNIFMCTGFTSDTHQYFTKPSPVRPGDYLEMFAEMDLLVATSTCPYGDVSTVVSGGGRRPICYGLGIEIYDLPHDLLVQWQPSLIKKYSGNHGVIAR